jgi:hypothetical protein
VVEVVEDGPGVDAERLKGLSVASARNTGVLGNTNAIGRLAQRIRADTDFSLEEHSTWSPHAMIDVGSSGMGGRIHAPILVAGFGEPACFVQRVH